MSVVAPLDGLLDDVFAKAKTLIRKRYLEIQQLAASDVPPARFFDDSLHGIVDIYAATAGAVWLRRGAPNNLQCVAQVATEKLGLTGEYERPHGTLLGFALSQPKPFLVRPNSAPQAGAKASNPTDSFVVFGPLVQKGASVGVIELFLGPRPVRGKTAEVRTGYVRFMEHLTPLVMQYLLRQGLIVTPTAAAPPVGVPPVPAPATTSPATIETPPVEERRITREQLALRLQTAEREIAAHREGIHRAMQRIVRDLTGLRPASLAHGRDLASRLHQMLDANGLRVACPQCGEAAILRCQSARGGALFVFDHTLESGRTFHGGMPALPPLEVVVRPPRRTQRVRRTPK